MKTRMPAKKATIELTRAELKRLMNPLVAMIDSDVGQGKCHTPAAAIRIWAAKRDNYVARALAIEERLKGIRTKAEYVADVRDNDKNVRLLKKLVPILAGLS